MGVPDFLGCQISCDTGWLWICAKVNLTEFQSVQHHLQDSTWRPHNVDSRSNEARLAIDSL